MHNAAKTVRNKLNQSTLGKLNEIERIIVEAIIEENKKKYPGLELHLQYLTVEKREFTGVGLYVNFGYLKNEVAALNINTVLSSSKVLTSPNLQHEIAYVLDIGAKINFLEIVTNGDDLLNPNDIENLKIV